MLQLDKPKGLYSLMSHWFITPSFPLRPLIKHVYDSIKPHTIFVVVVVRKPYFSDVPQMRIWWVA